ncbi:MAG: hypothetical protein FRX48_06442 [Lasallia pustulata]|uniref:MYND-type domain-containing protein n=1 Tax=Lasallia pustulata TaxID=136370 RepID=A0A5M8PLE4_9LECA|nr:MAG: hypothetical protein FRX48_06442 [Lasallia pustulata]
MASLPRILIITGDVDDTFRNVWTELLQRLKATSHVTFSSDPVSARRLLLGGEISSVLLVSPRPFLSSQEPYRILRDYVRNFAERQGGTVLFCGTFSSFVRPTTFELYFTNEWKLPWRSGSYVRETFKINTHFNTNGVNRMVSSTFDPATAGLYHEYSQKALHVKGVSKNVCVYINSESDLESQVAPEAVSDKNESPTVFQCYGKGHVGFLGDCNGEDGTIEAILAMCGVTSTTRPPIVAAGAEDPEAGGWYCSGCGRQARMQGNAEGQNYKYCSRCKMCHYCSDFCQKAHWEASHKKECKFMNVKDY